ncbi:MAG: hypothetical protein JRJ03_18265 [Deltaproteobacteria bacterium]|nr:hypothetical protein [Deltaproteobacteria bacterium]
MKRGDTCLCYTPVAKSYPAEMCILSVSQALQIKGLAERLSNSDGLTVEMKAEYFSD